MTDLLSRMNASVQKAQDAAQVTYDVLTGGIDIPVTVNGSTIPTLSTRIRDYLESLITSGGLRGDDGVGVESIEVRDQHLYVKLQGLPEEDLGQIVPDDAVGVSNAEIRPTSGRLNIHLTDGNIIDVGRVTGTNAPRITKAEIIGTDLIFSFSDGTDTNAGDVAQFAGMHATGADITEGGDLVIIYADGSVQNLGRVVGAKGANGDSIVAGFVDVNGFLRFLKNDGSTFNTGLVSTTVVDGSAIEVQGARLDGDDLVLELTNGDYYVGSVRGVDGTDGTDGVGVEDVYIDDADGNLYVTLTGQAPRAVGKVQHVTVEGSDISVLSANVNSDGELEVEFYLSGNVEFKNLGRVIGHDGADGTVFVSAEVNSSGELVLVDADGNSMNAGEIEQISVTGARVDQDSSHLYIELSNGSELDVGEIERGIDGIDGEGVNGAYISDGDLYLTFTNTDIPDANMGNIIAPIETAASLSSDGDLTITLSDGQVFDLGNVRGEDGVYIDSAEVVGGELILHMSNGTTKNVGQIEKDPTEVNITEDGRLHIKFSDDTFIETVDRVQSRDGDTIEDIYFDGHDLVIEVSTDNNNTSEKVAIPAVYGYSITDVNLDESSRILTIGNNLDDVPRTIEIPEGIDGNSVTEVKFDGNDVLITANIDGTPAVVRIPEVKGETIENVSIDADGNLVFDVSGEDAPLVFETIKGVDAVETIEDIYLDGNDLVIVKPDETLVVTGVRGEDGNTITNIEYSDSNLNIQTSGGDSVTIPDVRGTDAPTIQSVVIDANEDMVITLSDATEFTVVGVGASVVDAQIDTDGKLELTLSNGETLTTDDPVVGRDGYGTGVTDVDFNNGHLTVTLSDVAGNKTIVDAGDVSMVEVSDVRLVPDGDEMILFIDFSDGSEKRIGNVKGSDGRHVVSATVDANDDLIVTMDDGSNINAGNVRGDDGRSVDRIEVLLTGDLIIYYDDGETKLAGNIGAGLGLTMWVDGETYNKDRVVINDGGLYLSLEDNNTDEPPTDKWVALALGDQITEVRRPVIVSPTGGESAHSRRPTITGSKYAPIVSSDERDYREIQIIETSGSFVSPVYSVQVDSDRHEVTSELDQGTSYSVRMRDVSARGYVSAWSDVEVFVIPEGTIETPSVLISSLEDRNAAFAAPEFQSTPFNNEFNHELHKQTDWQIIDDETGDVVWESLGDESNLTTVIVPFGNLVEAKTYAIRVRHRADTVESPWSDLYTFTTQSNFDYFVAPVVFYDGADPSSATTVPTFTSSRLTKAEEFKNVSAGIESSLVSMDWEITDTQGELVASAYGTTGIMGSNRLRWNPEVTLIDGEDYYVRGRHNTQRFGASEWGDWLHITVNQNIETPVITTSEDINDFPSGGVFEASPFLAANDEHISTSWEVRDLYSDGLVLRYNRDTERLTSLIFYVTDGLSDRDLYVRAKHHGRTVESEWSEPLTFATESNEVEMFYYAFDSEVREVAPDGSSVRVFDMESLTGNPVNKRVLSIDCNGGILAVLCRDERVYDVSLETGTIERSFAVGITVPGQIMLTPDCYTVSHRQGYAGGIAHFDRHSLTRIAYSGNINPGGAVAVHSVSEEGHGFTSAQYGRGFVLYTNNTTTRFIDGWPGSNSGSRPSINAVTRGKLGSDETGFYVYESGSGMRKRYMSEVGDHGGIVWSESGSFCRPRSSISSDGDVIGYNGGTVRRIDKDGAGVVWAYNASTNVQGVTLVNGDNVILHFAGGITMLDSSGNEVWTLPVADYSPNAGELCSGRGFYQTNMTHDPFA